MTSSVMFKNNYQGGAVVEIFCAQGNDPVAKWKLSGGAIHKEFNKEIKGFVYCLEGSSQTVKMQMPQNGKMSLGLLQRFLVLQVNVPHGKDFSTELLVTDTGHLKRRLYLSSVHKELSTTLWHAKIPLVGLTHSTWSTLCIDLVSFTRELFKGVGFMSLDGIALFATCRVRRIFTMKAEPDAGDDIILSGVGLVDLIPRSCHFPPDVKHTVQVLNIESLRKGDLKTGVLMSNCVSDQSAGVAPTRSSSHQKSRPQGVLQTASGSRVLGPRPQSEVKSRMASDGESSALCASNMGSPCCKLNQKCIAKNQSNSSQSAKYSHEDCFPSLQEVRCVGTAGILQPHPPNNRIRDKESSQKLRVYSPGQQKVTSPDDVPVCYKKRNTMCTPSSSRQGSTQQPLSIIEETESLTAEKWGSSPAQESPRALRTQGNSVSSSLQLGLPSDLQVWNSWESNEETEPQLSMEDCVFTFSSQPHTPRRCRGVGDQENAETGESEVQNLGGRRCGAQPEDDFIGSESDEDEMYTTSQQKTNPIDSGLGASRCSEESLDGVHHQTSSKESSNDMLSTYVPRAEPTGIAPKRCLSPNGSLTLKCRPAVNQDVIENSSVSLSRRLLQEVQMFNSKEHKDEEDTKVLSNERSSHLLDSLQLHQDDDELRMLASLKREQEEDECRPGFSASQIHQCNVSISMSSDDTSTWTHVSTPDNQGHHYQKEMNPLLCSNPREWMDVLSPPIMPPSLHRRSGNTWNKEDLVRVENTTVIEEEAEEEYLNLLYDPCLNCYFDPKSGKYYELA